MNNQFNQNTEQNCGFSGSDNQSENQLWQYIQSLNSEAVEQLSKPQSHEALNVMEHNIVELLGGLSAEQFDVTVSTSRENLGRLLASAMMSGYFLRNAEQRRVFEESFQASGNDSSEDE
ncbi:MAG: hypothetical protein BRC40_14160 [Cyanobacteria bacterium QH_8_48_120]|jgi:hypothetical protein|nr:MAG: hypothetical protein BRC34_15315 [Cyanobacteria bacterium QH_1_48_107]PSO56289.1 MAG: hypothetical protein BRC35_09580 [Cyanobacteria bacterium QH_10_48_56]PSO56840.1 MAG: hypothetical protein BRC39_16540 [Cyanobacteria bacterium QH_7_48_89]PSO62402.1 MAG: hypothetical protein BRC36_10145 [Cyanobacteria bacterium QH_2_48_84]PSO64107.1 MAG: hypothetical protein BRC38_12375 [Cyanobacteria bacterium QH_6_48_35]PSO68037.1 MAG: hypothetical protein BRC42_14705 [Cyanobacteria bacterium QS_1_